MEGIHVGFGRRICTDASSKPLPIATRIVCGLFIALAQIRRAKLRCTCHGAIFERVLVRRTQEYKSIPRTTSRKSPEIAHVRRHGSLPCMPLFSPREPRFRRRVRGSRGVFSRHMSGKRRVIIWTKRQQAKPVFSSRSSFREPRKTKLSLRRTFTRRRRMSLLFFGLCPKNFPNFFTFHYNL